MAKFIIQPHGRLQEWIAHEKGYFRDEGLDYEFAFGPSTGKPKQLDSVGKVPDLLSGAFESYKSCLLYTSPSPRDRQKSRMPSSA